MGGDSSSDSSIENLRAWMPLNEYKNAKNYFPETESEAKTGEEKLSTKPGGKDQDDQGDGLSRKSRSIKIVEEWLRERHENKVSLEDREKMGKEEQDDRDMGVEIVMGVTDEDRNFTD